MLCHAVFFSFQKRVVCYQGTQDVHWTSTNFNFIHLHMRLHVEIYNPQVTDEEIDNQRGG